MRNFLTSLLAGLVGIYVLSSFTPDSAQRYVDNYAGLAVQESVKSGIPASVILAQGILESGAGRSVLTRRSNNHFGIKWLEGMPFEYTTDFDDDYKNGVKVPSKFVVYASSAQSYEHHTEFLERNPRYRALFQLSRMDYEGWSKGLQACNYATEKSYAQLLIAIIVKYKLDSYDIPTMLEPDDDDTPSFAAPVKMTHNFEKPPVVIAPSVKPVVESNSSARVIRISEARTKFGDDPEGLFEITGESATKIVSKTVQAPLPKQNTANIKEGLYEY